MPLFIFNSACNVDEIPNNLANIIDEIVNSENRDNIFLILPTNKWARAIEAKLFKAYYNKFNKPSPNFNIFSLSGLLKRVAPDLSAKIVSDSHQFAVFQESIKNANLNFFKGRNSEIPFQLSKKLFQIVKGLREDGLFSDEIAKDLTSNETDIIEPRRLSDMKEISSVYEAMLGDSAYDDAEAFRLAYLRFKNDFRAVRDKFNDGTHLWFFGFSKFKKPEINFLSLFAKLDISLSINFDYSPIEGPLFSEYEQLTLDFTGAGFERKFILDKDYNPDVYKLKRSKYLRETLFRSAKIKKSQAFCEIVKIYEANDKNHEIKSIAKLVKSILADKSRALAPADICVVTRKADQYSSKFRDLFYSANIPAYISDRYPLGASKPTLALIAILDLITNGYKQGDFNKIHQNDFLDFSNFKNQPIDIKLLIDLSYQYKVFGGVKRMGLDNWTSKFKGVLDKKLRSLAGNDFEDDFERMNLEKEVKLLERGINEIKKFNGLFYKYDDKISPKKFKIFLYDIISEFDLRERIKNSYRKLVANKDKITDIEYVYRFELIEKNAQALSALIKEIESFCDILEKVESDSEFRFDYIAAKFKAELSEAKYQIREKEGYGVTITSFEQIRGIDYPVVIFCGMNEGEFPIPFRADTFVGKELKDSEENHYAAERTLFFQTLINSAEELDQENSNKRIYLFYSKLGNDKELTRSQYIDELFRILDLERNKNFFSIQELESMSPEQLAGNSENSFVNSIISPSALACEYAGDTANETLLKMMQELKLNDAIERIQRGESALSKNIDFGGEHTEIKAISVSQLEEYAKCPFAYYANRVLRLGKEEKLELEITAMEQGSILHTIAHKFYSELRDYQIANGGAPIASYDGKNLYLIDLDKNKRDEYWALLKVRALEELDKINNNEVFFEIDRNEIIGANGKIGILEKWLDSELERADKYWNYKPTLFEYEFGLNANSNANAVDISEILKLKGKIDRIDAQIDPETGELAIIICDYKNKKAFDKKNDFSKIINGEAFQMPLYLAAAKELVENEYKIKVRDDGAYYFSFAPQKADKAIIEVIPAIFSESVIIDESNKASLAKYFHYGDYRAAINESIKKAEEIVIAINKGYFPINPLKQACLYCKFKSLCRIDEINKYGESEE